MDVSRSEQLSSRPKGSAHQKRANAPNQRAPLEEQSPIVTGQTDAVENSSRWTEEEPHWLTRVWGDRSSQAKLQVRYRHYLSQWYIVAHYRLNRTRLNSDVVATSYLMGQFYGRAWTEPDPIWRLVYNSVDSQPKYRIWEGIRFNLETPAVWTQPKVVCMGMGEYWKVSTHSLPVLLKKKKVHQRFQVAITVNLAVTPL